MSIKITNPGAINTYYIYIELLRQTEKSFIVSVPMQDGSKQETSLPKGQVNIWKKGQLLMCWLPTWLWRDRGLENSAYQMEEAEGQPLKELYVPGRWLVDPTDYWQEARNV